MLKKKQKQKTEAKKKKTEAKKKKKAAVTVKNLRVLEFLLIWSGFDILLKNFHTRIYMKIIIIFIII